MKMILGVFFALGCLNITFAQDALAYAKVHAIPMLNSDIPAKNQVYLTAVRASWLPTAVRKFRSVIAAYNIKTATVFKDSSQAFSENKNATYTVLIKDNQSKVLALYNVQGKVLESKEVYKSVSLPKSLRVQLAKEYPGWLFTTTQCEIRYKKGTKGKVRFKVGLTKEGIQITKRIIYNPEALAYLIDL